MLTVAHCALFGWNVLPDSSHVGLHAFTLVPCQLMCRTSRRSRSARPSPTPAWAARSRCATTAPTARCAARQVCLACIGGGGWAELGWSPFVKSMHFLACCLVTNLPCLPFLNAAGGCGVWTGAQHAQGRGRRRSLHQRRQQHAGLRSSGSGHGGGPAAAPAAAAAAAPHSHAVSWVGVCLGQSNAQSWLGDSCCFRQLPCQTQGRHSLCQHPACRPTKRPPAYAAVAAAAVAATAALSSQLDVSHATRCSSGLDIGSLSKKRRKAAPMRSWVG